MPIQPIQAKHHLVQFHSLEYSCFLKRERWTLLLYCFNGNVVSGILMQQRSIWAMASPKCSIVMSLKDKQIGLSHPCLKNRGVWSLCLAFSSWGQPQTAAQRPTTPQRKAWSVLQWQEGFANVKINARSFSKQLQSHSHLCAYPAPQGSLRAKFQDKRPSLRRDHLGRTAAHWAAMRAQPCLQLLQHAGFVGCSDG